MPAPVRAWQADESLSDLTLYGDWDSISSMILSLRIHLFEHGTIPIWNFMFCGGRPELAVPYSWAWTWPSAFAYLLPPNFAILAAWIALTALGFAATRALLLRWSGDALGAATGASVYAFGGLFAARFNGGHVTFAFYHLVPVLMLVFERAFQRALAGGPNLGSSAVSVVASFAFMSAALPHPLIHFYPAFALLVTVRVVSATRRLGARAAFRAALLPVTGNALGAWLAAYKLWPVVSWQLHSPRKGVATEGYDAAQVIGNTLHFVPDYFQRGRHEDWHTYAPWGYNAYVGPVPWLLALLVIGVSASYWVTRRRPGAALIGRGARAPDVTVWYGLGLVAIGLCLSLGNAHALTPGALFRNLPVLDGVRAFNRFQVLIVFGLAVLTAHGFAMTAGAMRGRRTRVSLLAALAASVLAPVLLQAGRLIWNVRAEPNSQILASYGGLRAGTPLWVAARGQSLRESRHFTSLLQGGYWIANCNPDLSLPGLTPRTHPLGVAALSAPPPERLVAVGPRSLALGYAADTRGPVTLNVRVPSEFTTSPPAKLQRQRLVFDGAALDAHPLTLTATYRAAQQGAVASALGAGVTAAFLSGVRLRDRSRWTRDRSRWTRDGSRSPRDGSR